MNIHFQGKQRQCHLDSGAAVERQLGKAIAHYPDWLLLLTGLCLIGCTPKAPTSPAASDKKEMSAKPSEAVSQKSLQAPSMSQICQNDSLLLLHFSAPKLFGTPLPKQCCAPGVLPKDDWRCDIDWPSSDVVSCESWAEMAGNLSALTKAPAAWMSATHLKQAQDNLSVLKTWHQTKYACADTP